MSDLWLDWPEALRKGACALLDLALAEDLGEGDVTAACFGSDGSRSARLVARQDGVLAGLPVFLKTFATVAAGGKADPEAGLVLRGLEFSDLMRDGERVSAGAVIARVTASEAVLSGAERTAPGGRGRQRASRRNRRGSLTWDDRPPSRPRRGLSAAITGLPPALSATLCCPTGQFILWSGGAKPMDPEMPACDRQREKLSIWRLL